MQTNSILQSNNILLKKMKFLVITSKIGKTNNDLKKFIRINLNALVTLKINDRKWRKKLFKKFIKT